MVDITGTTGNDTINGTAGDDTIDGKAGDDLIDGGAGDDALNGGTGDDTINGGDGDDRFEDVGGSDTFNGGLGNDSFVVIRGDNGATEAITINGGDGNDRIDFYQSFRGGTLTADLGPGNDFIRPATLQDGMRLTLGTGRDLVDLSSLNVNLRPIDNRLVITDFATGMAGDVLELSTFLNGYLQNWDGSNPFGVGGFLRLVQQGTSTLLQVDRDGTSGSASFLTLTTFENVTAAALTADNFNGFAPDGSTPVGRTITGTASSDTLTGGGGADTISGLGGNDTIDGKAGNDLIDGGAGDDSLNGGTGDDTIEGGDGDDRFEDVGGSDTFNGGLGNDSFVVIRGDNGATEAITINGGDGNDRIDFYQSFRRGTLTANLGAGDDAIRPATLQDGMRLTLGTGRDLVDLSSLNVNLRPIDNRLVITDFASGAAGDVLELSTFLNGYLQNWDGSANPFGAGPGYLRLVQVGSTSLLQIDRDGSSASGFGFSNLIRFENTTAAAFAAANFAGFAPRWITGAEAATAFVTVPATVLEGTDIAIPLTLTLKNVATASGTVTLGFDQTASTAINGSDLSVPAASSSYQVAQSPARDYQVALPVVPLFDDTAMEGDETVAVTIRAPGQMFDNGTDTTVVRVTIRDNDIVGTAGADMLTGTGINETILGLDGGDTINGGGGRDTIFAGGGNDTVLDGNGQSGSVDLGLGDDSYRVGGTALRNLAGTGGDGFDTLEISNTHFNIAAGGLSGFERLVLQAAGNFQFFSGFQTITLAAPGVSNNNGPGGQYQPGAMYNFVGSNNPLVDVGVAGQELRLHTSTVRSVTGGAGGETVTLGSAARVDGPVQLGGGGDRFTINLLQGGTLPTFGRVDGGDGSDVLEILAADAMALTVPSGQFAGFETVQVNVGYVKTASVTLTALVLNAGTLHVGDQTRLTLAPANLSGSLLQGAFGGGITIGAGSTVGRYGMPDTGPYDRSTDLVARDATLSVELVNRGAITAGVKFYTGDDVYDGRAGQLSGAVYGNGGNDTLLGGADGDQLYGGHGDDLLAGGLGSNSLYGGAGNDTASYADAGAGVRVSLANQGTQATGGAGTDYLFEIENILGSAFADQLTGDGAANILTGGRGDDRIEGGAGVDLAAFEGLLAGSGISFSGGRVIVSGLDGRDTLTGIETLRFADGVLDVARAAPVGELYSTYIGRDAGAGELSYWVGEIAAGRSTTGSLRTVLLETGVGQANTAAMVSSLYQTYFGRAADAGEIDAWKGAIRQGSDFTAVRTTLLDHPIGQQHTAVTVDGLYQTFFGRAAAGGEIDAWRGAIRGGADFGTVRTTLIDHPFGQQYASVTVDGLYRDYFGRPAAAGEIAAWTGAIRGGADYGTVRTTLLDHPLGQQHTAAEVDGLYRTYFGRAAQSGEISAWADAIRGGADFGDVRLTLLDHPIGQQRTAGEVDRLYRAYFGRPAQPSEVGAWAGVVRDGATFEGVLDILIGHPASDATGTRRLTGTGGADRFDLSGQFGHVVIEGFDPRADTLNFSRSMVGDDPLKALRAREVLAPDGTRDVLLSLDDGQVVLLQSVTLADLTPVNVIGG